MSTTDTDSNSPGTCVQCGRIATPRRGGRCIDCLWLETIAAAKDVTESIKALEKMLENTKNACQAISEERKRKENPKQ